MGLLTFRQQLPQSLASPSANRPEDGAAPGQNLGQAGIAQLTQEVASRCCHAIIGTPLDSQVLAEEMPMINIIARMADGTWQTNVDPPLISDLVNNPNVIFWVDLNQPNADEYDILRDEFAFHPLAIEDVIQSHQRPKIDIYDHYYFLVLYALTYDSATESLHTHELEMFVGRNYVVTVHKNPIHQVKMTLEQWRRNVEALGVDIGALVYTLMDRIVDDYFPVIDAIAERMETLEQRIFEEFDRSSLEDIFLLKKQLLGVRRLVAPERDVFNVLLRRDPMILSPASIPYFQDVYDHTIRASDSLDTYRDLLSSVLDAYLSVQGNRLNEIIYRLTIISTIFLPLTFLTGFFGMNFTGLPFESTPVMILALLLMVITPVTFYRFLRRNGWR